MLDVKSPDRDLTGSAGHDRFSSRQAQMDKTCTAEHKSLNSILEQLDPQALLDVKSSARNMKGSAGHVSLNWT